MARLRGLLSRASTRATEVEKVPLSVGSQGRKTAKATESNERTIDVEEIDGSLEALLLTSLRGVLRRRRSFIHRRVDLPKAAPI